MFINLLQKNHQSRNPNPSPSFTKFNKATPNPSVFWWAHRNWGSNLNLKRCFAGFMDDIWWYWFLLQKKTPYSPFTSFLTNILCSFCRCSFKLRWYFVFSKSSKKKNHPRFFFIGFFVSNQNFSKSVSYVDLPNRVDEHEATHPPRNLRLWRHFFLGDPIQGSLSDIFRLKGGVEKFWCFWDGKMATLVKIEVCVCVCPKKK